MTCMQIMQSVGADDELDEAAMFEKIVAGDCDTNDPVWLGISQDAQQLVVCPPFSCLEHAQQALPQQALCACQQK